MGRHDGKTQKASPQKRRKAREEGQVARSQEVAVAASLLGGLAAIRLLAPSSAGVVRDRTGVLFAAIDPDRVPSEVLRESALAVFAAGLAPFLALAVFAALVSGVSQVGFRITPKAAKPKWDKISPKQGLKRLAPAQAGWEVVRSTLKLGMLAAVIYSPLAGYAERIGRARALDAGIDITVETALAVMLRAVGVALVVAAADYGVNRYRHERELKMSFQDVKDEHKQSEGDPAMKAARRRRASEISRNRMMSAVATADVVITNPTHLAVALRYSAAEGAPRVVAKGADRVAAKIRKQAYRNGVPVIENKPVARALFRRCRIDQFVPAELYEAVAVVLATVYRRKARRQVVAA